MPRLLIAAASRCRAQALGPWASVVVAHGLRCSMAHGIFLDQGSNPCTLCRQAGPQPRDYQGSPCYVCILGVSLPSRNVSLMRKPAFIFIYLLSWCLIHSSCSMTISLNEHIDHFTSPFSYPEREAQWFSIQKLRDTSQVMS